VAPATQDDLVNQANLWNLKMILRTKPTFGT